MASASLPRVLALRALTSSLARPLRPTNTAALRTWRALSAASHPSWRRHEHPANSRHSAACFIPTLRYYSSGVTLTVAQLEEQVLSVLKMFDKVKPEKVTLEAHFINDLGMDSLDAVEVVMAFEDEFGCEITDEEAEKIFSAKDAVELLKTKLDVH